MAETTFTAALNGPCCKGRYLVTPDHAQCETCLQQYDMIEYPAMRAERAVSRARALEGADDATCFFHAKSQAEAVCSACGRFLCPVCAVNFGGRVLCPTCIATGKTVAVGNENSAWQPDGLAFLLATVPLLMWPFTIITAPAALVIVVLNWKKPSGPIRRTRWKRWVAGVLSLVQVAAWAWFITMAASR